MAWQNPIKRFGRFVNPHIRDIKRGIWNVILWRFGYYAEPAKKRPLPGFRYPAEIAPCDRMLPWAVWLGHSSYLIKAGKATFLTDPLFSEYCSPVPLRIFQRRHRPPMKMSELPSIDYVLISHNHYDHLDAKSVLSLFRLQPHIVWVVPRGVKRWFLQRGIYSVVELDWGEARGDERCRITAVPAQHFSGRGFFDQNRTLWCGFIVECGSKTFYFVGDTGYNGTDFKEIGKRWPEINLSLIPIGTYVPKKFMQTVHISPYDAVQIHLDVHSHLSLGMHWKTFCLSEEPLDLPPFDLLLAMQEKKVPCRTFLPIDIGTFVNW